MFIGGGGAGGAQQRAGLGGRGSGGQEAPVHWHSRARGHAALVTQQKEDDVHHVLHLCGQSWGQGETGTPSLLLAQAGLGPLAHPPLGSADSPANLPSGIRSSMAFAFRGSLQLALPMGVITTVGFTVFTRICAGTGGSAQWAGGPWAPKDGGQPSRPTLWGPSSRAITLVSMSMAPLVAPVRRDCKWAGPAAGWGRGGCRRGHSQ